MSLLSLFKYELPANVTGTGAALQAIQTRTGTGKEIIAGTITTCEAIQAESVSGKCIFAGTVAVSQVNQTRSATGGETTPGVVSESQTNQARSSDGTIVNPVDGTAAETQAGQSHAATGMGVVAGAAVSLQTGQTGNADGKELTAGTTNSIQSDQYGNYAGELSYPLIANLSQAQQTCILLGELSIIGHFNESQSTAFVFALSDIGYTGAMGTLQVFQTSNIAGESREFVPVTGGIKQIQGIQTETITARLPLESGGMYKQPVHGIPYIRQVLLGIAQQRQPLNGQFLLGELQEEIIASTSPPLRDVAISPMPGEWNLRTIQGTTGDAPFESIRHEPGLQQQIPINNRAALTVHDAGLETDRERGQLDIYTVRHEGTAEQKQLPQRRQGSAGLLITERSEREAAKPGAPETTPIECMAEHATAMQLQQSTGVIGNSGMTSGTSSRNIQHVSGDVRHNDDDELIIILLAA